jgi:polyprenyl-phospho-N-acetylgalactosaminyl synthase
VPLVTASYPPAMGCPPGSWVVVPCYNEKGMIGKVVRDLTTQHVSVVVVDDGSVVPLDEQDVAGAKALLRHSINLGQGAALQTGLQYAIRASARFIATFDADGQHDPLDLPRMFAPLMHGVADIALGTRFGGEGRAVDMPASRRFLLGVATAVTRVQTGLALTDTHNGLRAMTADTAARLALQRNRMAHASEILQRVAALQLRAVEIPVTIRYTSYSMSKGQRMSNMVNILWESMTDTFTS